jgi:MoaA/NifB/PqqE/SkfB family radical SAM enzyme
MRGLPGSWDRAIDTYRRLRAIRRSNFQTVVGMTLLTKNADAVEATIDAVRAEVPEFKRTDLHLNIGHESGHYFDNLGQAVAVDPSRVARAIADHRRRNGAGLHPVHFLENRYQALVPAYYETGRSPLPCSALSTSCFIDAYWNLFPCSIWDEKIGNLRETAFDLAAMWNSARRVDLRQNVVDENCPHCWTPCEAYPTVLGNLARAVTARGGSGEIGAPATAEGQN